jgi:hypothetical protein
MVQFLSNFAIIVVKKYFFGFGFMVLGPLNFHQACIAHVLE